MGINSLVSKSFKQLNMFRHLNNADNFGYGLYPSRMEYGAVVLFTNKDLN